MQSWNWISDPQQQSQHAKTFTAERAFIIEIIRICTRCDTFFKIIKNKQTKLNTSIVTIWCVLQYEKQATALERRCSNRHSRQTSILVSNEGGNTATSWNAILFIYLFIKKVHSLSQHLTCNTFWYHLYPLQSETVRIVLFFCCLSQLVDLQWVGFLDWADRHCVAFSEQLKHSERRKKATIIEAVQFLKTWLFF